MLLCEQDMRMELHLLTTNDLDIQNGQRLTGNSMDPVQLTLHYFGAKRDPGPQVTAVCGFRDPAIWFL